MFYLKDNWYESLCAEAFNKPSCPPRCPKPYPYPCPPPYPTPCPPPYPHPCPPPYPSPCPPYEPAPFLSSYIEAVGSTQTVANGEYFAFDIDPDYIDIVGTDIEIDDTGTVFTFTRTGLYRVEWSMNVTAGEAPVLIGLLENGEASSALSNGVLTGNYASGALIYVEEVPYTLSLHNFGAPLTVTNPMLAQNTAVSIRISRFADGPAV